ncbi:hypothetical protein [Rhodopirellula sp. SWK7]|uniref:hypothetical protein n=1 Tax=Rhodopirellula sp. SWK7 TaxID=595460 RepID=UPI0002C02B48|nr:hypothetical protein [Rhodopirellula sp. SWK7]EMI47384.1 hypothetical protein RRSWK_00115 [Rhodopirellula sp. SWK7]
MESKSFVYYVPGRVNITSKQVLEVGLASQCSMPRSRGISPGPDGGSGITVVHKDSGITPGETPGMKWIAAPKGDAEKPPFWIGFDPNAIPGPEDLQRRVMHPGKTVTLASGQSWQVPELFRWHEGEDTPYAYDTRLPCMLDIDDYGRPKSGQVVPQYRRVFDLGLRVLMNRHGGSNDLMMTEAYQFLIDVLAINYRVTMLELSPAIMDSIRTDEVFELIDAATDAEGFLDIQKKVAGRLIPGDTSTPDGSSRSTPEETLDTDQPAEN